MLGSRLALDGCRVLDLFAGSGALGLEALSRGAGHATFVDNNPKAIDSIRQNISALGYRSQSSVCCQDWQRALKRLGGNFALILADPPYAIDAAPLLPAFATQLAPTGLLVLELSARVEAPQAEALTLAKRRDYGDSAVCLYQLASAAESPRPG